MGVVGGADVWVLVRVALRVGRRRLLDAGWVVVGLLLATLWQLGQIWVALGVLAVVGRQDHVLGMFRAGARRRPEIGVAAVGRQPLRPDRRGLQARRAPLAQVVAHLVRRARRDRVGQRPGAVGEEVADHGLVVL